MPHTLLVEAAEKARPHPHAPSAAPDLSAQPAQSAQPAHSAAIPHAGAAPRQAAGKGVRIAPALLVQRLAARPPLHLSTEGDPFFRTGETPPPQPPSRHEMPAARETHEAGCSCPTCRAGAHADGVQRAPVALAARIHRVGVAAPVQRGLFDWLKKTFGGGGGTPRPEAPPPTTETETPQTTPSGGETRTEGEQPTLESAPLEPTTGPTSTGTTTGPSTTGTTTGPSTTGPTPDPEAVKAQLAKKFRASDVRKAEKMQQIKAAFSKDEFLDLCARKKVGFKDLINALTLHYGDTVGLGDLTTLAGAVKPGDRKKVWSDTALMAQIENVLSDDDYLTFLNKIGMHAKTSGAELGEGGKEHTPPAKADKTIRDILDSYISGAVSAGRKIEGLVSVVGGGDWDKAGVAHYGSDVWHTGPPPKKSAINGFVDSKGRVWIEKDSGNPGTMIHEGLHKYSDPAYLSQLGFNMNEGTTEYFTRIICQEKKIKRGNYANQFSLINDLVGNGIATRATLAAAYVDGSIDGLKQAFVAWRKSEHEEDDSAAQAAWATFVTKFKASAWSDAAALLEDKPDA